MKLHTRLLRRNQAGDTIVEVLIAVAIVSSVLMGAFYVTQRSAQAVRASQERSEAYQLLQGQVELVRQLALAQKDQSGGVYVPNVSFCVDSATGQRAPATGGFTLPALDDDTFDAYPEVCKNRGDRYNVAVHYEQAGDIFRFTARWDGLNGRKSEASYAYRIHPGK